MKTQIKRFSKSTLAVVLSICMLISCMTVGIIATDAAQVSSEAVGDTTTYYLRGSFDNWAGAIAMDNISDTTIWYTQVSYTSDFEFKVANSSNWSGKDWGSGAISNIRGDLATLTTSGSNAKDTTKSTHYIMFDTSVSKIYVSSELVSYQMVKLVGQFNGSTSWSEDLVSMTYEGNNIYSYTVSGTTQCKYRIKYSDYDFSAQSNSDDVEAPTTKPSSNNTWRTNNKCFYFTPESGVTTKIYVDTQGNADDLLITWIGTESASTTATVTFGVESGSASNGSLTAQDTTTSTALSSGDSIDKGDSVTFTAVPDSGYTTMWYSDSACTTAISGASGNSYTTTVNAATSVYVKFVLNSGSYTPTQSSYYLEGKGLSGSDSSNQWDSPKGYFLIAKDGNYYINVSLAASGEFRLVGDGKNYGATGTDDSIRIFSDSYKGASDTYSVKAGGNDTFMFKNLTAGDYTIWYNSSLTTVWITSGSSNGESGGGGSSSSSVKIYGTLNGNIDWTSENKLKSMDSEGGNVFSYTITSESWFRFNIDGTDWGMMGGYQEDGVYVDYNLLTRGNDSNHPYSLLTGNEMSKEKSFTINPGSKTYKVYVDATNHKTWVKEVYSENSGTAYIYAKDGVNRKGMTLNDRDADYVDFPQYHVFEGRANTKLDSSTVENYDESVTEWDYGEAQVGSTIRFTTTVSDTDWYVRAFCINGVVYEEYEPSENNTYTMNYKIALDDLNDNGTLEITPIYWKKSDDNTVLFEVRGLPDPIKNKDGWGNTISADFYYSSATNSQVLHLEGFPGQPLIHKGSQYYTRVPVTLSANDNTYYIQGVTLNNTYWDYVHQDLAEVVNSNKQTYDYDDFYKIFVEENPSLIIFEFKYRTQLNNFDSAYVKPVSTGVASITDVDSFTNGWDYLVNAYGDKVDIFGNVLSGSDLNKEPLRAVSNGYMDTYQGYYSTQWNIYAQNATTSTTYDYVTCITPSARWIKNTNLAHFNDDDSTYVVNPIYGTDGTKLSDYLASYNTLNTDDYKNRPVLVSYEQHIDATLSINTSKGDQKGDRNDGVWLFANDGDQISASIEIEYYENGEWNHDDFEDPQSDTSIVGNYTKTSAFFSNSDEDFYRKNKTGTIYSDSTKKFNFSAKTAGDWVLEGWFEKKTDANGTVTYERITKENVLDGDANRTNNAVFVARFKKAPSGSLTISHTLASDSLGRGKTYLDVTVVDTNNSNSVVYQTAVDNTNDVTIPAAYVKQTASNYKVTIVLRTQPYGRNTFNNFSDDAVITDAISVAKSAGKTVTTQAGTGYSMTTIEFTLDQLFVEDAETGAYSLSTSKLPYYSHLNEVPVEIEVEYIYDSRFYETQSVKITRSISGLEIDNYITDDHIAESFVTGHTPYEDNFREVIEWKVKDPTTQASKITYTKTDDTHYKAAFVATQTTNNDVTVVFQLPYEFKGENDYYAAVLDNNNIGKTKADNEALEINGTYKTLLVLGQDSETEKDIYLRAPATLGSKDNKFQYWELYSLTSTGGKGDFITKCYSLDFNFIMYEDYYVIPHYGTQSNFDLVGKTGASADISFLEFSRNQWNAQKGTAQWDTSDRVYADFALTYDYNLIQFNKYNDTTPIEVGIVIETLGDLEKYESGLYNTNMSDYRNKYGDGYDTDYESLISFIENGGTDVNATSQVAAGKGTKVVIASSTDNEKPLTLLSDKNRIQYYNGFKVSDGNGTDVENKTKLYRVYAYIMVDGQATVSSAPVYINLYETAVM